MHGGTLNPEFNKSSFSACDETNKVIRLLGVHSYLCSLAQAFKSIYQYFVIPNSQFFTRSLIEKPWQG